MSSLLHFRAKIMISGSDICPSNIFLRSFILIFTFSNTSIRKMEHLWDTNLVKISQSLWNSQAVMYLQACSSLMHRFLHQWEQQDNDQVYFLHFAVFMFPSQSHTSVTTTDVFWYLQEKQWYKGKSCLKGCHSSVFTSTQLLAPTEAYFSTVSVQLFAQPCFKIYLSSKYVFVKCSHFTETA